MSEALDAALQAVASMPHGVWVVLGKTTRQRVGVFDTEEEAHAYCAQRNAQLPSPAYKVETWFFPRSIQ